MMYGYEKSDPAIVAGKSTNKCGAIRCGVGGAKGRDQGECGPTKHALDSEPVKRVTGVGSHTANYRRVLFPLRLGAAGSEVPGHRKLVRTRDGQFQYLKRSLGRLCVSSKADATALGARPTTGS